MIEELGTYFIPEGSTRTLVFPGLRDGNDESKILLADDRDTLLAPVYVEEAETDSLLLLKQYNAGRLIEKLKMMQEYEDLAPGDAVAVRRTESGTLEASLESVKSADDAM